MEFEKLKDIIVDVMGCNPDEITMDTTFVDDLGADSLDIFQIIMGIEDAFDIEIENEDAEKIATVGDAVEQIKNRFFVVARDGYRYYQFPAAADGTTLVLGFPMDSLFSDTTPVHILLTIPEHNVHIQLTGTVTAAKTVLSPPASRMNDGDIATLAQIRQSLEAIWKMIQSATQTTN